MFFALARPLSHARPGVESCAVRIPNNLTTVLRTEAWKLTHVLCTHRALAALGAEIVQADLSSVPSLVAGFKSANAIFVNTDYWETYRGAVGGGKSVDEAAQLAYDSEISWGKNAADAAAAVAASGSSSGTANGALEKFIYSAFGSMRVASGGKYARCQHFESKAVVAAYIADEVPQLADRTSFIYASGYADNPLMYPHRVPWGTSWMLWLVSKFPLLAHFLPSPSPRRDRPSRPSSQRGSSSGWSEYLMLLPGKMSKTLRLPVFIPHLSTGPYVRCLVEDELAGTRLLAVDWWLGLDEGMHTWEKVTGLKAQRLEIRSVPLFCRITGTREEVVEGAAYLAEFPYMCDVQGWIEPSQLKNPPPRSASGSRKGMMSYEEYLRTRDLKELLE